MMIKNCPKEAYDYEFIIVEDKSDFDPFVYYAHTNDRAEARKLVKELEYGSVLHNVKISKYNY